jgi:hypothetical protein
VVVVAGAPNHKHKPTLKGAELLPQEMNTCLSFKNDCRHIDNNLDVVCMSDDIGPQLSSF